MQNHSPKDEAWYRELKGKLKSLGVKDSDELFAAKTSMVRHMKRIKLAGILMIIVGIPAILIVVGIPLVATGIGAIMWSN